jgi:hypothetical protein
MSRFTLIVLGLAWAAAASILLVASAAGMVLDRPFNDFSRDPVTVLEGPAYIGFVSSMGAVGWAIGVGACLVGALALGGRVRLALACGGLLTAVLMADDLLLVHEAYIEHLGLPMVAAPIIYAGLTIGYLVVFREFLRDHGLWILLVACACFALSAGLDVTLDEDAPFLVEDGSKLFGIVTWSSFFVLATVGELQAGIARTETT